MPHQLTLQQEERLLTRLRDGESDAFRELYEAFSDRLYRAVILPRIGVPDLAEDVLRETFLTTFEKIGAVRWQGRSLYYWLSRIAANKVIDVHRANRRTDRFVKGFTPFLELSNPGPPNPEEAYLIEERVSGVQSVIGTLLEALNPRYRRAIELRFFEERARDECAAELEVTLGNFDVILFRAIKRLKTLLERTGEASGKEPNEN